MLVTQEESVGHNHFHTKCLRIIVSIKWQDMVPDTEVLTRAGIPRIHTLLQKAQVRWAVFLSMHALIILTIRLCAQRNNCPK